MLPDQLARRAEAALVAAVPEPGCGHWRDVLFRSVQLPDLLEIGRQLFGARWAGLLPVNQGQLARAAAESRDTVGRMAIRSRCDRFTDLLIADEQPQLEGVVLLGE